MASPQALPAAAAPPRKGAAKRLRKWILLGASVLVVALGGVVALRRSGKAASAEPVKKPVVVEPSAVEPEPFVLNLSDPAGDRYFRLKLSLVLDQRAIAERLEAGLAQAKLRDSLLSILARKRASQMTSTDGKELLRAELMAAAEGLLGEAPFFLEETDPAPARVLDVYFTEFLVQ
jgi:flagellar basal body-associated protein FliL